MWSHLYVLQILGQTLWFAARRQKRLQSESVLQTVSDTKRQTGSSHLPAQTEFYFVCLALKIEAVTYSDVMNN